MIRRTKDNRQLWLQLRFIFYFTIITFPLLAQTSSTLRGFTYESSIVQKKYEEAFKRLTSPETCRRELRYLTEEPHLAGTENSYKIAQYLHKKYQEYGLDAQIYEYTVYLPYPIEVRVEMIAPTHYLASGKEESWEWDKDSYETNIVAGYNAYSPDGDVTADLIYVNKGLPDDYQKLAEMGISVEGKIAIARYGGSYRGVKAKIAGEQGAVGLIIYSDPVDDGYMKGDVYPRGPWRSADAIQRGTVKYIFQHAGDPLTPGWASTKEAHRIPITEATDLPRIPVAPLAYRDAEPLLRALAGPNVPRGWQGGLPFAYHIGPGLAKVRLKVRSEHKNRPIYNVIAKLKGTKSPDQWVILGNHHDAWVYGAADPGSGTATLLEVARCLGQLAKEGYRPKRTIVFANWDAEEFGIIGSAEWAEDLKAELQQKAIAYLNVDTATTGTEFYASAVPSLKPLVKEVAQTVMDPQTHQTVYEAWRQDQENHVPRVGNLGSGSDHSPFIGHLGIPSISMGFYGPYGVYHAMQDNFYWLERFADPTFRYHVAMAQIWGIMGLRLAEADILPFDYARYADELLSHLKALQNENKHSTITKDRPERLRALLRKWEIVAAALHKDLTARLESGEPVETEKINRSLQGLERILTSESGLPLRPWYKHLAYAPGLHSGYAAAIFPGIQDALEMNDEEQASIEVNRLAEAFQRMIEALEQISDVSDSL
ncbi:hypothetical protein C6502_22275 [Candidatus Poribacteria bacterium]|nr:MAG: hypothetical protein C6502_22275 [Candidatus Poribacteria bacterium]